MVCVSVIATGVVMHLGSKSRPLPHWVKRLFLDFLARILCQESDEEPTTFSLIRAIHSPVDDTKQKYTPTIQNPNANTKDNSVEETNHNNGLTKGQSTIFDSEEFRDVLDTLRFIKTDLASKNACTYETMQWRRVSIICDRLLLLIFLTFMVTCTLVLAIQVILGSQEEAHRVTTELRETKPGEDFQIIIK